MKKIILWTGTGIFILGILVAGVWWWSRPQVVQLDKNTKLTLLGVDYGRHHKYPAIKTKPGRRSAGGQFLDTTNDTLVVWILQEHPANNWPNYQTLVYDRAETACVENWMRTSRQIRNGMEIVGVQLNAYPRRDRKFYLRFASWDNGGRRVSKGKMVITNPVRDKSFPQWTPGPLPDTQSDGDLDVTLNKLVVAPAPWPNRGGPQNDPLNRVVQFDFDATQNGAAATNWHPMQIVTTDATGNRVVGWVNKYFVQGENRGWYYQPGLWPNETAWKVRLEFSRASGFSTNELWSVRLPVRRGLQQEFWSYGRSRSERTGPPFAETALNNVQVKVFPAMEFTDPSGTKLVGVIFQTVPDPEALGMRMTSLDATDDRGRKLSVRGTSWGGGDFRFEFAEPRQTESLDLTIALHQSRFVEFTVAPAKP